MFTYSQKDLAWAELKIGKTQLTLKHSGCAITACANMFSDFLSRPITPKEMLEFLNKFGGFDIYGNISWKVVSDFVGGRLRYRRKIPFTNEKEYWIRKMMWGMRTHFVLMINNTQYIDSWDGQIKTQQDPTHPNNWIGNRFFAGRKN